MRVSFLLVLLFLSGLVQAGDIDAKVEAALAAESRPAADIERDRNRKPLETLKFFGLEDDMTVLELIPGGGWYTRVLAPALADKGKLYVALGTRYVSENVLTEPGFEKVTVIETDANVRRPEGSRYNVLDEFEFGIPEVDMVLTFRNVHNFDKESRDHLNRAVFDVLKPGGLYGVVDHTKRHMEPENPENRRRVDPVLAVKEMLDIGFEFVDYSDLHYRPDDELRFEVGRRTVTGNTDRFTFLFRKP